MPPRPDPHAGEGATTTDWDGVRLHVVTGKGGTGKTTVAAALAMALASGGRRTLLVEVEERQGIARLFDCSPLPYADRKVAIAPDGGDVFALAVEAKAALLEYLEMFYRLGRAGKALEKIGAVDFATTIAPGLRDVLLTGKVYEAVRRRQGGRPVYDAVVLDAPPTGRIGRFLNVNEEVAGLAKVGPVRNQADAIMSMLRSPRTVVHLVTVLEEMPVQETGDAVTELGTIGLRVGGIVVNMVREPVLGARQLAAAGKGRLDAAEVRSGLVAAGLVTAGLARGRGHATAGDKTGADALVDGLLAEAGEHSQRVALERRERAVLADLDRPTYELPRLSGGVELGDLYDFARRLLEQGMA